MKKTTHCDTCEFRGYSHAFCKAHFSKIAKIAHKDCPHHSFTEVGKTVVFGAGVGIIATTVGLAAVPAAALKALFGHVVAVKIYATGGGSVAGAGIGFFRKVHKKQSDAIDNVNRRTHMPIVI
ncbi:MAG: hypothetical protein JZU67_03835 [Burkholderiaceae bacterium]|nr:hypothetical protein [Burkholderiaceae bacterium]